MACCSNKYIFAVDDTSSVLSQIEQDKAKYGCFSEEKSTVIRLVLNRNNKNKYNMKNELDEQNASMAYLCGRLFALICKLQFKAQGEVNSSIKDRFLHLHQIHLRELWVFS